MKKIFLSSVLALAATASFAQKKDIVLIPRIVMENGTVVNAMYNENSHQVVLDIKGNEDMETLEVFIEKDGIVLDEQVTYMENDRIVVDTDINIDGNCKVVLRQKHEEVEVAETTDTPEE